MSSASTESLGRTMPSQTGRGPPFPSDGGIMMDGGAGHRSFRNSQHESQMADLGDWVIELPYSLKPLAFLPWVAIAVNFLITQTIYLCRQPGQSTLVHYTM